MLIENGILRVRAGLNPVLVSLPLVASTRRGVFARAGDLSRFGLYARTWPTPDARREWLRRPIDELEWTTGTELAHAVGYIDPKTPGVHPAHDRPELGNLALAFRLFKNNTNFEVMLTIAWRPSSSGLALVIGNARAAERRVRHLAQRAGLTEAIVVDPYRLVLTAHDYDDVSPPIDNFLGRASARLAMVPAPDAPLVVLSERAPRRAGETGTTVAIDFGTHETSVVTQREGQRDITVQGPLAPWSFHTVEVKVAGAAWHAELIAPPRSFEERTTVGNPVMPRPVSERWSVLSRRDGPRRDDTGVPSVLIPSEALPHGIHGHPFDELKDRVIGHRALRLVRQAIERGDDVSQTGDGSGGGEETNPHGHEADVEVDALEPAPKLQLGRDPSLAYQFLDGVMDDLAAREIVRAPDGGLGAIGPVLLSYPVALLASDREVLQRVAREALENSALRGLCDDPPEAPLTFLDEATAASLGVLYHRFGSLSLDRLLDAFQPLGFDPESDVSPRAVRVLTFDCGGGTTDLVLLRLREDGDRIVSEIEDFYGLPFAGVEITRRIARELKRKLRTSVPSDQTDRLRTRFGRERDPAAGRTAVDRLRQKRTLGFFYFCEAVKMALTAGTLAGTAFRAAMAPKAQQFLPELDPGKVLDALPTRAWLEECAATVLAPALETAERWLSREDAPVQVLLASGRSSQLPGVSERLRAACVKAPRPVMAHDFLSPRELASTELGFGTLDLHGTQPNGSRSDLSKLGVAIGLAHGYVLTTKTGEGRRLVVKPIDEHKRTRYIGVLRQEGRGVQYVMPEDRLVVRADGATVDRDTVIWIDEQPFAVRAVLGQNFRGPPRAGAAGSVDPPIPFAQLRFSPTAIPEREKLGIKHVQVGLIQRTASEVVLAGLRVESREGVTESLATEVEGVDSLTAGGLTVHFETQRLEFDFRRNGAIDPEDIDRE